MLSGLSPHSREDIWNKDTCVVMPFEIHIALVLLYEFRIVWFVEIHNDYALDLEEVCEVLGKVIRFLKSDNKDDSTSYDVLDKFAEYYLDIEELSFKEIYILPTLKIAVQKKLIDHNA